VLIAEENGRIMAIAPLMLSKYSFANFAKLTRLEFMGTSYSDYNSFIWLENEELCLKLFLQHLVKQTDWESLELSNVREGTLSEKLLRAEHADYALKLEHRIGSVCPYVKLSNTMEEFMTKLSRDMRHQIRRKTRRLQESYRVDVKTYLDFNSIREAMREFFDLHEKRWRGRKEPSDFASDTVREFQLELAERLAERGWFALSFLTADDKPVAADLSFDYQGKRYGYQSGFDPAFSDYAVGTLLRLRGVETCIAKGLSEFDFTRGGEPYKLRWPTQVRNNFQIWSVRRGLFAKLRSQVMRNRSALKLAARLSQGLVIQPRD